MVAHRPLEPRGGATFYVKRYDLKTCFLRCLMKIKESFDLKQPISLIRSTKWETLIYSARDADLENPVGGY